MIINDTKLASFKDMFRNFADKNGLTFNMITPTSKSFTEITVGDVYLTKNYVVKWNEVSSLSDAAASIFGDAIVTFSLKKDISFTSFEIKDVIFNDPATIVLWKDGTKTVVKCQPGDIYDKEMGLALCVAKKALGNQSNFNNVFKKWIPEEVHSDAVSIDLADFGTISTETAVGQINKFCDKMKKIFGGENA